jgi:hypothetical protein
MDFVHLGKQLGRLGQILVEDGDHMMAVWPQL